MACPRSVCGKKKKKNLTDENETGEIGHEPMEYDGNLTYQFIRRQRVFMTPYCGLWMSSRAEAG